MRPLKSIQARWQTYTLSHYKNSFYGRKLQKLKNIHKGERCFIVANGPSLTSGDLNMLYNNKEITFGMNRIYKFFEKTQAIGCLVVFAINLKRNGRENVRFNPVANLFGTGFK